MYGKLGGPGEDGEDEVDPPVTRLDLVRPRLDECVDPEPRAGDHHVTLVTECRDWDDREVGVPVQKLEKETLHLEPEVPHLLPLHAQSQRSTSVM